MSHKIGIRIVIFLMVAVESFSQTSPIKPDTFQFKPPSLIVKLVPSALINLTIPSAQAGLEYQVYKSLYVGHELGIMIDEAPYKWRGGFRHMTEARLYLDKFSYTTNQYIGMNFRYWWFRAVDEGIFCRQNCLFTQTFQYQIEQSGVGLSFSYGRKQYIFSDKTFFEYGFSMGRIFRKNETDLPSDAEISGFNGVFFDLFGRSERWRDYGKNTVILHLNFRIGVDIR